MRARDGRRIQQIGFGIGESAVAPFQPAVDPRENRRDRKHLERTAHRETFIAAMGDGATAPRIARKNTQPTATARFNLRKLGRSLTRRCSDETGARCKKRCSLHLSLVRPGRRDVFCDRAEEFRPLPRLRETPMSRFDAEPHPLLRPFVHSYWGFVRDLSQTPTFTVTPDCFIELLFFVDPPEVEESGERRKLSPCTLIPLLSEPLCLVTGGVMRCASVRFHAWAAGIIFPQANHPTQLWYDVSAMFPDLVPVVIDELRHAAWSEIATAFDATLVRRLADTQSTMQGVGAAQAFLAVPDGTTVVGTGDVAQRQTLSRRQIERQVRALTNRSPKQLVCLTRFQFVRDTLWARPQTELDRLALEAGYADQAHLSRHFRRYAGQSPSQFKRDSARLRAARSPDVAIVQDAAFPPG